MIDMTRKEYIPSILKYLNHLSDTYQKIKTIHPQIECQIIFDLIKKISSLLDKLNLQVTELIQLENEATNLYNSKQAHFYKEYIVPKMSELRLIVDTLETIVSKEYWPVPSYTDLLFNE